MKQLALLAIADRDVDLLRRVRHHPALSLQAIYHPDPSSLVIRLGDMAALPVFTSPTGLLDLPLDVCVGDDGAADVVEQLAQRAGQAGRPGPVFVPLADVDRFLCDPDHWKPIESLLREVMPSGRGAPLEGGGDSTIPEVALPVAGTPPEQPDAGSEPASAPAGPPPVVRVIALPPHDPVTPAPPPAMVNSDTPPPPPTTLGVPTIDLFYEPARLAGWLVDSSRRLTQAESVVIWQRDQDGHRFRLMSFSPGPEALPSLRFGPDHLEALTQAGHWQTHELTGPSGDRHLALFVPLTGESEPFGLLGLFRPFDSGEWTRSAREELTLRLPEIGLALDRCVRLHEVGRELAGLRFKERVRDLLLDATEPARLRWARLLRFLLEDIGADLVSWFEATADLQELRLVASATREGAISGEVSVPAGIGRVGRALRAAHPVFWFREEPGAGGEDATLPVLAGFGVDERPVGVLVFEGLAPATGGSDAPRTRLERLQEILRPLVGGVTTHA